MSVTPPADLILDNLFQHTNTILARDLFPVKKNLINNDILQLRPQCIQ